MKTGIVGVILTFLRVAGAGIPAVAVAAVPAPVPIDDFSDLERLNPRRCGA